MIVVELVIVFTVTLGLSGLRSLVSLLDSLLRPEPLADQQVALNVPQADVQLLDLVRQLLSAAQLFAWGALGLYLLWRAGIRLRAIGLDRSRPGKDLLGGAGLAALIGIPGLAFYFLARAVGANLTVLPSTLDDTWWRPIVLTVAAAANAWAEEVLVVGYLITRLRQLGRHENASLVIAAVLRGSYHLYQGFGGFLGNVVMGLVFGRVWQRTNRLWPLVIAHTLLDVVAFVGYALLRGAVSWLP
ncbi:MAG: CPBP family intramembrane metalloprotease [Actinophytocola sp.]|uniref:CPBP family intramembrane glutamic endopeptidase n=1 Tax=Actinophytocola sp. TaxID=1872138 RepID=UPI00132A4867|nr:CPBP family intramembrane glutamic endopeptidase [Actinophytocola sp.]MPZ80761.1 CPBP family intramembrane metalloprotease [Actinophytocola sp.]